MGGLLLGIDSYLDMVLWKIIIPLPPSGENPNWCGIKE
jgi:hypothetical protein